MDVYAQLKQWYIAERPLYENLAKKVADLIKEILDKNNIEYHSITYRAKEIDSLLKKAKDKQYKDPINEIQDYAGIRVITFVKSEVIKACDLIKPEFTIDEKNSSDKSKELGEDKVGYRSVHYIASFDENRLNLTEYSRFKNMNCEIQIRTILEHAWADISHDRTYKFNNSLPEKNEIKRRFALAAATLEMVDREFDRLSTEIEEYSNVIANDTLDGKLNNYEIDGTSLMSYLEIKFQEFILDGRLDNTLNNREDLIIYELDKMGINTLKKLDDTIQGIPNEDLRKLIEKGQNYAGLLRTIMIVTDVEKYFKDAWNDSWQSMPKYMAEFLKTYVENIEDIINKYEIELDTE